MVCDRNAPDALPSANGRKATFFATDVREVDQIAAVIAATTDAFGSLDVVVNNAGGTPPAFVAGTSTRFASIITLNLVAPLLVAQHANDVMQTQPGGGSIINIGSVNGMSPAPGVAAYGAAKAGLVSLTQSLAVEFAPKVRVNQVTAGIIGTPEIFAQHYDDDAERIGALTGGIPMGRMTTPEDVRSSCLFLASPLAANVAGANLLVHGGGDPMGALPLRPGS